MQLDTNNHSVVMLHYHLIMCIKQQTHKEGVSSDTQVSMERDVLVAEFLSADHRWSYRRSYQTVHHVTGKEKWQTKQLNIAYILQLNKVLCLPRPLAVAVRSTILCFRIRSTAIRQPGNSLL